MPGTCQDKTVANTPRTHLKRISNAPQTHFKRNSNTSQTHLRRTANGLQTHHKRTAGLISLNFLRKTKKQTNQRMHSKSDQTPW